MRRLLDRAPRRGPAPGDPDRHRGAAARPAWPWRWPPAWSTADGGPRAGCTRTASGSSTWRPWPTRRGCPGGGGAGGAGRAGAGGVPGRRAAGGPDRLPAPARACCWCWTTASTCWTPAPRLADALLRACPGLRVLATSREALGLTGESRLARPALAGALPGGGRAAAPRGARPRGGCPCGRCDGTRPCGSSSTRVATIGRASSSRAENAAAVAQICGRLDGLPLALELAAARVRALSVDALARRLDDRFRLLTGGDRTALPRQQTLRATVDWSHALLSEAERVLLRRLAVFAGDFALDAAEAVAADPLEGPASARESAGATVPPAAVLVLLSGLVEKSLVVAEARPGTQGAPGRRATGCWRRSACTPAAGWRRGRPWPCAAGTWRGARRWRPATRRRGAPRRSAPGGPGWSRRPATCGRPSRGDLTASRRSPCAWWSTWPSLAAPRPARRGLPRWLERGLPQAPARTALRAEALYLAGRLYRQEGEMTRARPALDESLTIAREAGDRAREAIVLHDQAQLARVDGQTARARGLLAESLTLGRTLGHPGIIGGALLALCLLALQERDLAGAKTALRSRGRGRAGARRADGIAGRRGPAVAGHLGPPGGRPPAGTATPAGLRRGRRGAGAPLPALVGAERPGGRRPRRGGRRRGPDGLRPRARPRAAQRLRDGRLPQPGPLRRARRAPGRLRARRAPPGGPAAGRAGALTAPRSAGVRRGGGRPGHRAGRARPGPPFAVAWRAGRAMSPERAVAFALEAAATPPPRPRRDGSARASSRWPT